MSQPNITPLKFHFYSLIFTPYKNDSSTSSNRILLDVINYLFQEKQNGKGHLINKNANRKNELPREIFMTSMVIMPKEKRIRCSIALLRSGKVPKIKPTDKFSLIPIDDLGGSVAEETHFYIDYNKEYAVLCAEYNYYGPRISDIEFYLRSIANHKLKASKATTVTMFMDSTIDKTIAELKNVLNIDIKIHPPKLVQMDKDIVGQYFTGINNLGNNLKPNFLKIEALFQSPGRNITSSELNNEANSMVKNLLQKFKTKPYNIDCFDGFVVKYEDKDGNEEVFNLLKGKKEISKEVDLKSLKKKRQLYELIEEDFNTFINEL